MAFGLTIQYCKDSMDKETQKVLAVEFAKIKADLIKLYELKGMEASGNWRRTLEVEIEPDVVKLTGERYSEQLEFGRRAGRFPPIEAIEQWIVDKGIQFIEEEISRKSLAFLIARKIAQQGWDRAGRGGVDLISEVITPKRIQSILDKVSETKLVVFSREINSLFQKEFQVA